MNVWLIITAFLCVMCLTGGFMYGWIRGYEDHQRKEWEW